MFISSALRTRKRHTLRFYGHVTSWDLVLDFHLARLVYWTLKVLYSLVMAYMKSRNM